MDVLREAPRRAVLGAGLLAVTGLLASCGSTGAASPVDPSSPVTPASFVDPDAARRVELEPELATDPMLGEVGWSWLVDALANRGVGYVAEAGTVTRVVSQSFAGLADRPASVDSTIVRPSSNASAIASVTT